MQDVQQWLEAPTYRSMLVGDSMERLGEDQMPLAIVIYRIDLRKQRTTAPGDGRKKAKTSSC